MPVYRPFTKGGRYGWWQGGGWFPPGTKRGYRLHKGRVEEITRRELRRRESLRGQSRQRQREGEGGLTMPKTLAWPLSITTPDPWVKPSRQGRNTEPWMYGDVEKRWRRRKKHYRGYHGRREPGPKPKPKPGPTPEYSYPSWALNMRNWRPQTWGKFRYESYINWSHIQKVNWKAAWEAHNI